VSVLVLIGEFDWPEQWLDAFAQRMPELEVRRWPDAGDPAGIDYALVWQPPAGVLASLSRLRIVFSLGAGLDHLAGSDVLPADVPVVRMVEDSLTEGMSEYVVYNVLRFHRGFDEYERRRLRREWKPHPQARPGDRVVGILGLGVLGADAARKLRGLGFDVRGWSRTRRNIDGIRTFAGPDELSGFLRETQILVCLLPLTPETRGLLDGQLFSQLPRGAWVINAGRGGHVVEKDLLHALASGQLAGAALDVFRDEPLPPGSPMWSADRLAITPHIASLTNPYTAVEHICDNIERDRGGHPLTHVYDPRRGY
jgi:glyoxylate/hydroxypyruvate reductase